jgi:hypothetical protein
MNATFPRTATRGASALLALLALWAPVTGSRAESPAEARAAPKHACTEIRDNAQRLACYDQAFGKPGAPAQQMRPAASAQLPVDQFGFTPSQLEREAPSEVKALPPADRLEAEVTAINQRPGPKFVVTLANGQVWQQTEIDTKVRVAVGDVVTIRRGALGSYLLSVPGGLATRAKRIR